MGSVSYLEQVQAKGSGRIIMEAEEMPEIIPMWISRFDTLMPETRGWPRPVPRAGGNVSITIGESLTSKIQPLVEEWKKISGKHRVVSGLETEQLSTEGAVRDSGSDATEKDFRIRICEALQDSIRALGVEVEREEGRFEKGEWSNSTKRLDIQAAKEKVVERPSKIPI
jgi:monolysocardiolipin acyltransferase